MGVCPNTARRSAPWPDGGCGDKNKKPGEYASAIEGVRFFRRKEMEPFASVWEYQVTDGVNRGFDRATLDTVYCSQIKITTESHNQRRNPTALIALLVRRNVLKVLNSAKFYK